MKKLIFPMIFAFLLGGITQASEPVPGFRTVVKVVNQTYCYGDSDVFTVSLDLRIGVVNSSERALLFAPGLVPYTGRVATSIEAAKKGRYVQEWTPSRYLTEPPAKARGVEVKPGHSFLLRIKYGVPARYRTTPKIPGTLPSGKYALQLVLRPKFQSARPGGSESSGSDTEVRSITTAPVLFEIPESVSAAQCH